MVQPYFNNQSLSVDAIKRKLLELRVLAQKNSNSDNVWLPPSATARLSMLIIWIPLPAEVCGTSFSNSSFLLSHSPLNTWKKETKKCRACSLFHCLSNLGWTGLVSPSYWWQNRAGAEPVQEGCDMIGWERVTWFFFFLTLFFFFSFFKVTSFKK